MATIAEARAARIVAADTISSTDTTELIAGASDCERRPTKYNIAATQSTLKTNTVVIARRRETARADLVAFFAKVTSKALHAVWG